jgi:hypothetical protein
VDDDEQIEKRRQYGQMMEPNFVSAKTLFLEQCKVASNHAYVAQRFEEQKNEKQPASLVATSSARKEADIANLGVVYLLAQSCCCSASTQHSTAVQMRNDKAETCTCLAATQTAHKYMQLKLCAL